MSAVVQGATRASIELERWVLDSPRAYVLGDAAQLSFSLFQVRVFRCVRIESLMERGGWLVLESTVSIAGGQEVFLKELPEPECSTQKVLCKTSPTPGAVKFL